MAASGEDGGGPTRPDRLPFSLDPHESRRLQFGPAHGPMALAAAPLRSARFPQSPPNGISQLLNVAGGGGPQSTAGRPLPIACYVPRPPEHLHSRFTTKS